MTSPSESYSPPTVWQLLLPHLFFLCAAVVIVLLSFSMRTGGQSKSLRGSSEFVYLPWSNTPLPQSCGSRMTFGISCPGCGLTRSFIAISHGKFKQAWNTNAASFLVYGFVWMQVPWRAFQISRIRKNLPEIRTLWSYLPMVICAIALIVQWLIRMSSGVWEF